MQCSQSRDVALIGSGAAPGALTSRREKVSGKAGSAPRVNQRSMQSLRGNVRRCGRDVRGACVNGQDSREERLECRVGSGKQNMAESQRNLWAMLKDWFLDRRQIRADLHFMNKLCSVCIGIQKGVFTSKGRNFSSSLTYIY